MSNNPTDKFVKVFTTPNFGDIALIKSLLDNARIPYYVKGENFGTTFGPMDGLSSIDVLVREDYIENAKVILKDFILPLSEDKLKVQISKRKLPFSKRIPYIKKIENKYIRNSVASIFIALIIIIIVIIFRSLSIQVRTESLIRNGTIYLKGNDYDNAIADFTEAIKIDPNSLEAYKIRGLAYENKKEFDKAISDFNAAIRIDPKHAYSYLGRGYAYGQKKNYKQAIADFSKSIELKPTAYAYSTRGFLYLQIEKPDESISDFTKAIEMGVNSRDYSNRGWAYYLKGDFEKSIADSTKAIEINPSNEISYYNRGLAYYAIERYDEALSDYKKAIGIKPARESYEEFLKYFPEKKLSDEKDRREEIIYFFKQKLDSTENQPVIIYQ